MTNEISAKEYLQNLRTLDYDLAIYELETKKLEERICSYSSHQWERVNCSDISDKTAELGIQLTELKKEAYDTCHQWVDLKIETLRVIDQIEDKRYQRVLYLYYFQGMTLTQIADFLNITYQWVGETKKRAIEEFDRIRHEMGLSFYVDTMLFVLKQYEEEVNYKLLSEDETDEGLYFKLNEKVLLRTDSKTQMEILKEGINNGIETVNEARRKLDLMDMEGGDVLIVNGTYVPLTKVGAAYYVSPVLIIWKESRG